MESENKKDLYFIGILPPENLLAEIKKFKKACMKKFNSKRALRLPAHITLVSPFHSEEEKIISLKSALKETLKKDIAVVLNGFSYFGKRVIYIAVEENKELLRLKKNVDDEISKEHKIKSKEADFIPHITIASKDLTEENFTLAWEYFKDIEYKKKFKAEKIIIFKLKDSGWEKFISL
ncbi:MULTISPECIES: RNA 2',3'-cyclic phosphodiesterase [Psychrilyobacter]|uniref:RNA 2',3'-cyclic phosphodiesterase n=1 Tax=Psychrilyobacter piezotolerans TaxID=2293438 RepID=A0ABX9KD34_9FUSO|nr:MULTISPECIES: RNA 2',3'-cyclic phosphodiesterase [Psychrilyobacter]MCS5423113.1 RNA 2',3'-cyclic phosphodiesterase [Psychrilyobacter sp. S5]NDI76576.1 RNA 2',3'-cyclic phosphodiesterase [Psychrilyobacter piezotolerans]RDE58898.1 RNA 2',3'-cyclic phosphodiesterase [Psychrilyobacter sp. S5]REI39410.1 RNA 2',3'-cyclic phosphodiesterase [Psychrilyobacter piezotolerans]